MKLTVVTFLWKPLPGYRSHFKAEHVNILARMVKRHYAQPYEFVCITDDPTGIDPDIRIIPLWDDHAKVMNPCDGRTRQPNCYRRLKIFARDAGQWLGERIVCLDLDCVIAADLVPLWNRKEDFIIWGDTNQCNPYNASMMMMTAGCRPQVWEQFDPIESPKKTKAAGYFGSDQAWLALILGKNEARWRVQDGVYSYRVHGAFRKNTLLPGARVIMFHGHEDPWGEQAQKLQWVRDNWK